jgi:hypothetical protein
MTSKTVDTNSNITSNIKIKNINIKENELDKKSRGEIKEFLKEKENKCKKDQSIMDEMKNSLKVNINNYNNSIINYVNLSQLHIEEDYLFNCKMNNSLLNYVAMELPDDKKEQKILIKYDKTNLSNDKKNKLYLDKQAGGGEDTRRQIKHKMGVIKDKFRSVDGDDIDDDDSDIDDSDDKLNISGPYAIEKFDWVTGGFNEIIDNISNDFNMEYNDLNMDLFKTSLIEMLQDNISETPLYYFSVNKELNYYHSIYIAARLLKYNIMDGQQTQHIDNENIKNMIKNIADYNIQNYDIKIHNFDGEGGSQMNFLVDYSGGDLTNKITDLINNYNTTTQGGSLDPPIVPAKLLYSRDKNEYFVIEFKHKKSDSELIINGKKTNKSKFHLVEINKSPLINDGYTYKILIHGRELENMDINPVYNDIIYPLPIINIDKVVYDNISKYRYDYIINERSKIYEIMLIMKKVFNISGYVSSNPKEAALLVGAPAIAAMVASIPITAAVAAGAVLTKIASSSYKKDKTNLSKGFEQLFSGLITIDNMYDNLDTENLGFLLLKDTREKTMNLFNNSTLFGKNINSSNNITDIENEIDIIDKYEELTKDNYERNITGIDTIDSKVRDLNNEQLSIKSEWISLRKNYINEMRSKLSLDYMPINSNEIENIGNKYYDLSLESLSELANWRNFKNKYEELKKILIPDNTNIENLDNICTQFYNINYNSLSSKFDGEISATNKKIIIPQFYDWMINPIFNEYFSDINNYKKNLIVSLFENTFQDYDTIYDIIATKLETENAAAAIPAVDPLSMTILTGKANETRQDSDLYDAFDDKDIKAVDSNTKISLSKIDLTNENLQTKLQFAKIFIKNYKTPSSLYNDDLDYILSNCLKLRINNITENDIKICMKIIKHIINNYNSFDNFLKLLSKKYDEFKDKLLKKNETILGNKQTKNKLNNKDILYNKISPFNPIYRGFTEEHFGNRYAYFFYGPPDNEKGVINDINYHLPYYFYSNNLLKNQLENNDTYDYLLNVLPLLPIRNNLGILKKNISDNSNLFSMNNENYENLITIDHDENLSIIARSDPEMVKMSWENKRKDTMAPFINTLKINITPNKDLLLNTPLPYLNYFNSYIYKNIRKPKFNINDQYKIYNNGEYYERVVGYYKKFILHGALVDAGFLDNSDDYVNDIHRMAIENSIGIMINVSRDGDDYATNEDEELVFTAIINFSKSTEDDLSNYFRNNYPGITLAQYQQVKYNMINNGFSNKYIMKYDSDETYPTILEYIPNMQRVIIDLLIYETAEDEPSNLYKYQENCIKYLYSQLLCRYKIITNGTINNILELYIYYHNNPHEAEDVKDFIIQIIKSCDDKSNEKKCLEYTATVMNILCNTVLTGLKWTKSELNAEYNKFIKEHDNNEKQQKIMKSKLSSLNNTHVIGDKMSSYNPANKNMYWVNPSSYMIPPHIDYIRNKIKIKKMIDEYFTNKDIHKDNIEKINEIKMNKLNISDRFIPSVFKNLVTYMANKSRGKNKTSGETQQTPRTPRQTQQTQQTQQGEDTSGRKKTEYSGNKFKIGDKVSFYNKDDILGIIVEVKDDKLYSIKKKNGEIVIIKESNLKLYKKKKESEKEKPDFDIGDNVIIIADNRKGEVIGFTSDKLLIIQLNDDDNTVIEISPDKVRKITKETKKGDLVKLSDGKVGELVGISPSGDNIVRLNDGTVITMTKNKVIEKINIIKEKDADITKLKSELESLTNDTKINDKLILQLNEDLRKFKLEKHGLESEERQKRLIEYERKQKELNYIKNSLYLKNEKVKSLKLLIEKEIERNKLLNENLKTEESLNEKINIEKMKKKMYDISKKEHDRNKLLKTQEKDKEIRLLKKKNKEYEELIKKNKLSLNKYKKDKNPDESIPIYSIKRTPKKNKKKSSGKKKKTIGKNKVIKD